MEKTQECFNEQKKILVSLFTTLAILTTDKMLPKFDKQIKKKYEEYQRVSICFVDLIF